MSIKDKALRYASEGTPVFPCNDKKQPIVSGGFKAASRDSETVAQMFASQSACLAGMPTGAISSKVIIDFDTYKLKDASQADRDAHNAFIEELTNDMLKTRIVKTMNDGRHAYFLHREGVKSSVGQLAPFVDTRADGGYIILPDGVGYTVVNDEPVQPLPDWLYERIMEKQAKPIKLVESKKELKIDVAQTSIKSGDRNTTLTRFAGRLRKKGLDTDQIIQELRIINQQCVPPLDDRELRTIAASIGGKPTGAEQVREKIAALDAGDVDAAIRIAEDISTLPPMQQAGLIKELAKKSGISPVSIKAQMKVSAREAADDGDEDEMTHHDIALDYVANITNSTGHPPITDLGTSYKFNRDTSLYESMDHISVELAQKYNDCARCSTQGQYLQIAKHMGAITLQRNFFTSAPIGVAAGSMFYRITASGDIESEVLSAEHRRLHKLPVMPCEMPTPKWDLLLADAFKGDDSKEQTELLRQIMGVSFTGLMAVMQKVALLIGVGRSRKSTIAEIMRAAFDPASVTSVAPDRWAHEYYASAMAGKLANFVGELSQDNAIPASDFKNLVGRDVVMARNPHGMPFSYTNSAAHIFCSNHFPPTRERSPSFYDRWVIVRFKNPIPDNQRIVGYAQQIIDAELAGILFWALQGACTVMKQGHTFSMTTSHRAAIGEWLNAASSAAEFLMDAEWVTRGENCFRASEVYTHYSDWCRDNNKKALGRNHFYSEIDYCQHLGFAYGRNAAKGYVIKGISALPKRNAYSNAVFGLNEFTKV